MENALRLNPEDVREQYERQLKDLQEDYGDARSSCSRKAGILFGKGRELTLSIQQDLEAEGVSVTMSKLFQ